MSTRKFIRAIQTTSSQLFKAVGNLTQSLMKWLLRGLLTLGRQPAYGRSGFVLPTTVLLIMVVLLTVGSIVFRTYTRTTETISERQQRVIYNAATPAIDRARAKLEFLFDKEREVRYPGGVPSENVLLGLMLPGGATIGSTTIPAFPGPTGTDPYTFSDESRINVGPSYQGDTGVDNAWRYRADTDGDGTPDATVVYSIAMRLDASDHLANATDGRIDFRANRMLVRNTPLSAATQGNPLCSGDSGVVQPQQGWIPGENNTSKLFKTFQVDAYVLPDRPGQSISTLEMQMDRQIDRGNKWGAWFRNDLEIYPGATFNWNGAMHTEGSLMVAGTNFNAYMISDPDSCLYTKDASEITVANYPPVTTTSNGTTVTVQPGFRGEFIAGSMRDDPGTGNRFGGTGYFHLWDEVGRNPIRDRNDARTQLTPGDQSVAPAPGAGPTDYALDPVVMQTKGISQHRTPSVYNTNRPDTWTNGAKASRRLISPTERTQVPVVDDTFRADNRYGPKPNYGQGPGLTYTGSIGTEIPSSNTKLVSDSPGSGESTEAVGLDGYWERRARVEGLRLIVGQRLELGDPAGWGGPVLRNGDNSDLEREALRPFMYCSDVSNSSAGNTARCGEARQRRALWDNLAAVQAMAVYHANSTSGNPDRPIACMASTVHPGTAGTLERSSTFENLALGLPASAFGGNYLAAGKPPIINDFFRGRGTNGWEFEFKDSYITAYDNANSTVRVALRNLAQYAGDPSGGAPSFTPVQDILGVHPFPSMSMWGDFSTLRRTLQLIEPTSAGGAGRNYASLSPADKTTLHTATCLLGMLAYNLDYLAKFNPADPAINGPNTIMGVAYANRSAENQARSTDPTNYYAGLRGALRALVFGTSPLGVIEGIHDSTPDNVVDPNGSLSTRFIGAGVDDAIAGSKVNQPDTYIRLLERWRDATPATGAGPVITGTSVAPTREQLNQYIALAQLIATKEQVARDRNWGFYKATDPAGAANTLSRDNPSVVGQGISGSYGPTGNAEGCYGLRGSTGNGGVGDSIRYLCSWRPRYPILFSLFPAEGFANRPIRASHGDVDLPEASEGQKFVRDELDSADEPQTYIASASVNAGKQYQVINQTQMADLISNPRATSTAWALPVDTTATAPGRGTPLSPTDTLIKVCFNNATPANQVCLARSSGVGAPTSSTAQVGDQAVAGEQYWRVPFKDSAFFNGREMMNTRALDVNLNFLRQANQSLTGDTWLPRSGIVYAFREDSISENNIVRRKNINVDWADCATEANLRTDTNCRMVVNTNAFASLDPPLSDSNRISPKPVDYYPDPDRRPNGFRLRQGDDLRRTGDDGRGLSFISDNPVYIQGNFNLHNSATTPEEEFQQPAGDDFGDFYDRTTFNGNFASITGDSWRPSEVVADAITILSNAFCDGSVFDGLTNTYNRTRYNCNGTTSSYQNQNRPQNIPADQANTPTPGWKWFHVYAADGWGYSANASGGGYREGDSPIYISPNGNPWKSLPIASQSSEPIYNGAYVNFNIAKNPNAPGAFCGQRVNAIIVSGLVPSRAGNSYGGLHNFPRFLENWTGCNMFISGSLIQLNFSTYATGPYDQDAWEVGSVPQSGAQNLTQQSIAYYDAPDRRWGYDVALQYAPAGPVARRFTSLSPTRNEFYSEPAADDAYMTKLLEAVCTSNPNPRPARCSAS